MPLGYASTLGGREEVEKQGIASGIALGSPCFSGDCYLQGFSESTTKNVSTSSEFWKRGPTIYLTFIKLLSVFKMKMRGFLEKPNP
jgi:hypothetical protein